MRRSKYGYLLLALLVITGLAGTITSTSITSRERKLAASHLKTSKIDLLKDVKDLSYSQLTFKPAPGKWSIKASVYHLAASEKSLWQILEKTMTQPPNPEKRSEIAFSDEQILSMSNDENFQFETAEKLARKKMPFKDVDEAITAFKSLRAEHIKYMKTTTEDLRNHVAQLPIGWIDCYQLCLFMSAHSNYHMQQIEQAKADLNFPSR